MLSQAWCSQSVNQSSRALGLRHQCCRPARIDAAKDAIDNVPTWEGEMATGCAKGCSLVADGADVRARVQLC